MGAPHSASREQLAGQNATSEVASRGARRRVEPSTPQSVHGTLDRTQAKYCDGPKANGQEESPFAAPKHLPHDGRPRPVDYEGSVGVPAARPNLRIREQRQSGTGFRGLVDADGAGEVAGGH